MKMYIIELIGFLIIEIFFLISFLVFKKEQAKSILIVVVFVFLGILGGSFILESPSLNIQKGDLIFEVNQYTSIEKPKTVYHFKDVTDQLEINDNVDFNKIGLYQVTFSIKTLKGMYVVHKNVNIVDTTPPEIILQADVEYNQSAYCKYQEPGYIVNDNYDSNLLDKVEISREKISDTEYVNTYSVSDSSGNISSCKRNIHIITDKTTNESESSNTGIIYLTFDDGPSSEITSKILDILKKKNIKATFFVVNYDSSLSNLVKREDKEGHSVAIHGYSHKYAEIYKSDKIFIENITSIQTKIYNTIGKKTFIFRFPGGSSNTISKKYNQGIMTRLVKTMTEKGFKYYDWNVDSDDAGNAKNAEKVYNNVIKSLRRNKSNIVLMHDFAGNTKTVDALERVIDYGIENGYKFSSITFDTPMITHKIYN